MGALASAAAPEAALSLKKSDQAVELKVQPPPGTHLNFDGPWKLETKGTLAFSNATGVFGLDAFNKATGTFSLPLAHKQAAGEAGEYTLTYFYCAVDNSWCKRAQAKGAL